MSVTARALPESAAVPERPDWLTQLQPAPIEAAAAPTTAVSAGEPADLMAPAAASAPEIAHADAPSQPHAVSAEQFGAHVAAVRSGGDALDTPSQSNKKRSLTYGVAATAAALVTTTPNTTASAAEFVAMTAAAAGLLGRAVLKSPKTNLRMARERINEPVQSAVDAYYELYKLDGKREDGTHRVAMHWYGPRTNKDGKSGGTLLYEAASLAKDQGVDELVIDTDLARKTVAQETKQPGEQYDTFAWLGDKKGLNLFSHPLLIGKRNRQLQAASPEAWIDYATEGNPHEGTLALASFLRKLKQLQPDHPAVTTAAIYAHTPGDKGTGAIPAEKRQAARQREFADAERRRHLTNALHPAMLRQIDEKLPPILDVKRGDVRRGLHQNRFIHLHGETVDIFNSGFPEGQTTLDQILEVTDEVTLTRMQEQLSDSKVGQTTPLTTKVRALEYVLYKTAVTGVSPFAALQATGGKPKSTPLEIPDEPPLMVQAELAGVSLPPKGKRIEQTNIKITRKITALLGVIAGTVTIAGIAHADDRYDAVATQAKDAIIQEHGAQIGHTDVDPKLVNKRLGEWSPLNTAWGDWLAARKAGQQYATDGLVAASQKLHDLLPGTPPQLPFKLNIANSVGAGGSSDVGNVPDGHENDPVWKITNHGTVDSTGLWLEGTASHLDGTPAHWGAGMQASWDTRSFISSGGAIEGETYDVPVTMDPKTSAPYMELTRKVSKSDFIYSVGRGYLPLPVKDGMMPVSATTDNPADNVNGHMVIRQAEDGMFYLVTPRFRHKATPIPSEVTYRVADARLTVGTQGEAMLPKPMGTKDESISTTGGMAFSQDKHELYQIRDILDQAVPGYSEAGNASQQRTVLANYLRNNFGYDTQPLSEKDLKHIKNWADYVRIVMKNQKANCNVAATLVAVSTHTPVAVGFGNGKGAGEDTLQVGEAHMVNITMSGAIDATPSNAKITTDVAHTGQQHGPDEPLIPWQAIAGMLVAAGATAASRRRVRNQAGNLVQAAVATAGNALADHAQKELDDLHISVLLATAAAAGQLLYGRNGLDQKKLLRMATAAGVSREQAEQYITRPHVYAPETRQQFKQHPEAITPSMRRAARLAGRIARRKQ